MSGYKYSAKPRLRSPKASANASKLESEVAVNFAMLVALDSPIDGASEVSFQKTTAATCGLLLSLKVMSGRVEGKIETWSDLGRSKDAAKVRQCAMVDRRSTVAENVDILRDKFGGAQDTREKEIDQSEGFDGELQR